jgi:RNA polymerase sigma-70 factor, ECF subfamily
VPYVESSIVASAPLNHASEGPDFHWVFQAHAAYVWHALRRLGVGEADAEDVAHDVFVQVHLRLSQYDPTRPIRPWLFAFAVRKAAEHKRQARTRLEVVGGTGDPPDHAPTALEQAMRHEALQLGHRALDGIELNQRAVFVLHELDGYPIPEVASALEIPLNTAYSRLRLARAAFDKAVRRLRLQRGEL